MRVLVVRDSFRTNYIKEEFNEYHEPGLFTIVCNSNSFIELPSNHFDMVIIDIVEETIEKGDFSFLDGLKTQKYRAALAMISPCAQVEAAKPLILQKGVDDIMVRPTSNDLFFLKMDELLEKNPRVNKRCS